MEKKYYFHVSVLVFLGILSYFVFYENLTMFREVQFSNNRDKQAQVERRVLDEIEHMITLSKVVSETDEIESMKPESIRRIFGRIKQGELNIANMVVFDDQGQVVAMMKGYQGGFTPLDQRGLRESLQGKTTLSNKFYTPLLNTWLITLKTPIVNDHNQIIGVFSIAISTEQFQKAMQTVIFDHQAVPMLLDRNGGVILYAGESKIKPEVIATTLLSKFQAKSGVVEAISPLTNVQTVYTYKQLGATGWYLVVAQPASVINQLVFMEAANHVIVILVGILLLYLLNKAYRSQELKENLAQQARLEKMEAIGSLAAGIAHEIRNPLTTIKGFLQLMQANPQKNYNPENLEIMLNEISHIDGITGEFLSLAKPSAPQIKTYNFNQLLQGIMQLMNSHAIMYNVDLKLELAEQLPMVTGDPGQTRQILLNLIKNAVEACETGGKVVVSSALHGDQLQLVVSDNGRGMTPDLVNKLGTPFLTTKETGTGLGLMVSFGIIHGLGGSINVESKVQKGTKITVLLPIDDSSRDKGESGNDGFGDNLGRWQELPDGDK